jgi:hypothetical protein
MIIQHLLLAFGDLPAVSPPVDGIASLAANPLPMQFEPTPDPGLNPPASPVPGLDGVATTFLGWLRWTLAVCGVVGLLICGIMMAVGRRGRSAFAAEGAAGIPWVIGGLTLGTVAANIVFFFIQT